jgi:hypothetical protein
MYHNGIFTCGSRPSAAVKAAMIDFVGAFHSWGVALVSTFAGVDEIERPIDFIQYRCPMTHAASLEVKVTARMAKRFFL